MSEVKETPTTPVTPTNPTTTPRTAVKYSFAPKYKYALVDLSGTVHDENGVPFSNAVEAIKTLQQAKIQVRFVTNTSKSSKSTLLKHLRRNGFDAELVPNDHVVTSAIATFEYLKSNSLVPLALIDPELLAGDFTATLGDIDQKTDSDKNCVLVGLAPTEFNYDTLNRAFRLIMNRKSQSKPCPLVAIHRANYFRDNDKELSLGPGAFIAAIEAAANTTCEIIGKPSEKFFTSILSSIDESAQPNECVMIGDDLFNDVGGAIACGMDAMLVRTGKFLPKDETNKKISPTNVFDNIVEACDYIAGREELPPTPIPSPPLSPREQRMAREIDALKLQVAEAKQDEVKQQDEVQNEDAK